MIEWLWEIIGAGKPGASFACRDNFPPWLWKMCQKWPGER